MNSRTLLLVFVMSLGALLAERTVPQAPQLGPAPGALVDIGGHKLHLRCVGPPTARPTVILEAGGGGFSRDWSLVQDLLSSRARTCAYDRARLGWSEPGPAPRTMRQEVFELHLLLEAAKVPPPFVLVGQSVGGLLVRLYTEQFGSDVVGVVLVDPTHESAVLGSVRYGGMVRVREKAAGRPVPEPRREGRPSTQYNPDDDYLAEELQQIYLARRSNPDPLGTRPLVVLAAGKRPAPPGMSEDQWTQLRVERDGQLIDLSRLSGNSKFILDPSSSHAIHIDNAQLVARAIEEVLAALSKGAPLVP
ncbi:MAG TPA: alpha/beta hydrolase [Candidatus Binatia bacterium]|nr:alpha/beta hydrolase [Candidatus Binatia bacterium]